MSISDRMCSCIIAINAQVLLNHGCIAIYVHTSPYDDINGISSVIMRMIIYRMMRNLELRVISLLSLCISELWGETVQK